MSLVILGSGNWGSALATVLAPGAEVVLWTRSDSKGGPTPRDGSSGTIVRERMYSRPLSEDDILIIAVPSAAIRDVGQQLSDHLGKTSITIVSASKGLSQPGFRTMSQVLLEALPHCRVAVLSGPNIASEVGAGKPAKAVLAAYDVACLTQLRKELDNDTLKFELSLCAVEVEFCAALKGVIAIAVGIADGLDLGRNFVGLLLTYGIHEFMAVGQFLRISTHEVLSIAGLGDLITTCWSTESRNYKFGRLLARQVPSAKALKEVGMVVEGVRVATDIAGLASLNVAVEIFGSVAAVIENPSKENLDRFVQTVLEYRGA